MNDGLDNHASRGKPFGSARQRVLKLLTSAPLVEGEVERGKDPIRPNWFHDHRRRLDIVRALEPCRRFQSD
jgi:hypothetical protein